MDQLAEVAQVSKRTLYAHFASKDDLITAYLEHVRDEVPLPTAVLESHRGLPPRERLLAIFNGGGADRQGGPGLRLRELGRRGRRPGSSGPPVRRSLQARPRQAAWPTWPGKPARQIRNNSASNFALVWDGAASRAVVLNSRETAAQARAIAAILIDASLAVLDLGNRFILWFRRKIRPYLQASATVRRGHNGSAWTIGSSDRDNEP